MKKFISIFLLIVILFTSCLVFKPPSKALATPSHGSNIIINQVYGRASTTDAAISHSFIELYNPTEFDIDLSEYSIQYAKPGEIWSKLDLSGALLPAFSSYLIRCYSEDGIASRYYIDDYDISWEQEIDNKSFKVALVSTQKILEPNLTESDFSIIADLVGTQSTDKNIVPIDYYETKPVLDISKQKTIRRIAFSDTGNNSADFESLDYRETGIDDAILNEVKPRSTQDYGWGKDIVPKDKWLMFSKPAGLHKDKFNLTLSTGYKDGIIYYTTDGSDPSKNSHKYTNPILIKEKTNDPNNLASITQIVNRRLPDYQYIVPTTNIFKGNVIKAQVFDKDGEALTDVYTKSYFVGAKYGNLPVLSLVTDEENFFGNSKGIYRTYNYYNRGSDWERPVHFEMFEPDGTIAISQNMGVRLNGGFTRNFPQKSLRLYAKKSYDSSNPTLEYDIFEGRAKTINGEEISSFKRILLRNSGNDNLQTMMRDAMIQDLAHGLNLITQAYRQSVVFLNGEFWGIYNIRERNDDESIKVKYDIDDISNIGLLEFAWGKNNIPEDYETWTGDKVLYQRELEDYSAYMEMWNWFNDKESLVSDKDYLKAQTFIDVDNFIDFYIINIYAGNTDWPGNNNELWRYRTSYPKDISSDSSVQDGRWRWILKDVDFGFEDSSKNPLSRLTETKTTDESNELWSTLFYRRLITNKTFKEKFINRFCDIINTNLQPSVVNNKIIDMASNISPVMQQHIDRWNGIKSIDVWNDNIDGLKDFASKRSTNMRNMLRTEFNLSNIGILALKTDETKGYLKINDIDINSSTDGVSNPSSWNGVYFQNTTQTITAVPYPGYKFDKFIVNGVEYDTDTINIKITSNISVQAIFTIN